MAMDMELLVNAIDMHVHAAPDLHPRLMNELEILQDAKKYGMRAIVSKSHYCCNAARTALVSSMIDGIQCFGGIVLNPSVGGFNPSAVDAAIRFGGKEVWMPSFYSKAHHENFPQLKAVVKGPENGLSVLKDGKLLPEMHEILDLIGQANVILGTSHCSKQEIDMLVKDAPKYGVKKIVITHPYNFVPNLSLKKQIELAEAGCYLELCLYSAMPVSERAAFEDFAKTISSVGVERVVLATDFGQSFHSAPAEGMAMFCGKLLALGINKRDIEIMIKENPAYLLDL